jgi:hypothetical protein
MNDDRVLNRREASTPSIVAKIKNKASSWIATEAKDLVVLF